MATIKNPSSKLTVNLDLKYELLKELWEDHLNWSGTPPELPPIKVVKKLTSEYLATANFSKQRLRVLERYIGEGNCPVLRAGVLTIRLKSNVNIRIQGHKGRARIELYRQTSKESRFRKLNSDYRSIINAWTYISREEVCEKIPSEEDYKDLGG